MGRGDGQLQNSVQALAIPMLNRAGVLASEDSDAFDAVMDSFGLPKSTDDEKGCTQDRHPFSHDDSLLQYRLKRRPSQ